MDTQHTVLIQRARVLRDLLVDTCTITPKLGTSPTVSGGILHPGTVSNRQYNGSANIPCRFDLSRAFRPDRLKFQITEVDEYNLELPHDMVVEPSDIITHPNGQRFEIRKVKDASNFDVTIECIIDAIGVVTDVNS